MSIVTISREFGSHGDTVAQLLCDKLGYRYFDKNLMIGLAVQSGLPTDKVVDFYEDHRRARTLVERLFGNYAAPLADPGLWAKSAATDAETKLTLAKLNHLILAAHAEGSVVIIGRGGQVVLRDKPDVLHVRLIAPLEVRAERHARRAGLTPDEAREIVVRRDRASADYVRLYYGADSSDLALYDLIINTAKVTPFIAADLIARAIDCLPPDA